MKKNGKVKQSLKFCPVCLEKSVITRCYMRKEDNKMERLEYCLNFGCGYKLALPFRIPIEREE